MPSLSCCCFRTCHAPPCPLTGPVLAPDAHHPVGVGHALAQLALLLQPRQAGPNRRPQLIDLGVGEPLEAPGKVACLFVPRPLAKAGPVGRDAEAAIKEVIDGFLGVELGHAGVAIDGRVPRLPRARHGGCLLVQIPPFGLSTQSPLSHDGLFRISLTALGTREASRWPSLVLKARHLTAPRPQTQAEACSG